MIDLILPRLLCIGAGAVMLFKPDDIPGLIKNGRSMLKKAHHLKDDVMESVTDTMRETNLQESLKQLEAERKKAEEELKAFEAKMKLEKIKK